MYDPQPHAGMGFNDYTHSVNYCMHLPFMKYFMHV